MHIFLEMGLSVLLLHKHPEYISECCKLINEEWKRSETARMRSLNSSCDSLPTNLILVEENKVIGHCKLSIIPSENNACYVETVVIQKGLRGKGLGSYLMQKTEEHCKNILQLSTIYLSTKDKVSFYSKLGYCICEPISIYGTFSKTVNNVLQGDIETFLEINSVHHLIRNVSPSFNNAPPPPPFRIVNRKPDTQKIYMKKTL